MADYETDQNGRLHGFGAAIGNADIEDGQSIPRIKAHTKKPKSPAFGSTSANKKTAKNQQPPQDPTPSRYIEIWKSDELVHRDLCLCKSSSTNPTGSMLLKKGKYNIDQQTYFRFTAFADYDWNPRPDKPDYFHYAEINFRIVVNGIDYGIHKLDVKFDTRTNTASYHQKQGMAHLSWGNCKQFISDETLLGRTLTMYRDTESGTITQDGSRKNYTYIIEIQ